VPGWSSRGSIGSNPVRSERTAAVLVMRRRPARSIWRSHGCFVTPPRQSEHAGSMLHVLGDLFVRSLHGGRAVIYLRDTWWSIPCCRCCERPDLGRVGHHQRIDAGVLDSVSNRCRIQQGGQTLARIDAVKSVHVLSVVDGAGGNAVSAHVWSIGFGAGRRSARRLGASWRATRQRSVTLQPGMVAGAQARGDHHDARDAS